MSEKFVNLLTMYLVARDYVETENRKYGLFEEKPTLDVALQERREARRKLLTYVAELESERRWIPVSEPPEVGKPVLVLTVDGEITSGMLVPDGWTNPRFDFREGEVAHWMQSPEPPVSEVQE
jgi:hypothetical protein